MKPLLKWLRAAWLIVGATLICLLVVDAALEQLLPEPHGLSPIDPRAAAPDREEADALADEPWVRAYFAELKAARRTRWEPYSYWRRQPFSGEFINIDAGGIRQSWSPDAPRLKVLMFGGSTVWGTGARDDHTLPSALARALHRRGLAVEVVNLGESGYVSGQELAALLSELRRGPPPDAVVFFDGVNDVYAALQSGRAGIPQNEGHRVRDFRVTDGLDNWLEAFPYTLEGVRRLGALLGSPRPPRPLPALAAELVQAYLANVRAVRALGLEFGFEAWFFWQPSVFTKVSRSASEERVYRASLSRHRDLQLAADAALSRHVGTGVVDLSGLFAGSAKPVFIDFCHLSEAGNARVAEAIAATLSGPLTRLAAQAQSDS